MSSEYGWELELPTMSDLSERRDFLKTLIVNNTRRLAALQAGLEAAAVFVEQNDEARRRSVIIAELMADAAAEGLRLMEAQQTIDPRG